VAALLEHTMAFADNLKQLPAISHLAALELIDAYAAIEDEC